MIMHKVVMKSLALGAMAMSSILGACGSSTSTPTPDAGGGGGGVTSGTYYHYVTDSIKVGSTVPEADGYAFNLDNDPRNVPDNAIGHVLAGLSSMLDVDGSIASGISAGTVIILHSVRADDLTSDTTVSWQVYLGATQANPVLTGGGMFTIDATGPQTAILTGAIAGGTFLGGPASVEIKLALVAGQPAIDVTLVGARIQATCTMAGCTSGKLGGGITVTDMMTKVIPAVAAVLNARIAADGNCSTMCSMSGACSSSSTQLLDLFDTNHDCMVTAAELSMNSLVQAILQPDVDLLDAQGKPCVGVPGATCDGVKESVSLGLGFTTKSAVFTAASEH
jgi:hypothetical protein